MAKLAAPSFTSPAAGDYVAIRTPGEVARDISSRASEGAESAVAADRAQGESVGASGTPYFIVDGHGMSGAQPPSAFESVIDNKLRSR